MSFIRDFTERGYFYQCTNLTSLAQVMEKQKIVAYVGFDCTAKSLHVGNLLSIMALRLLQQHGHKPIVLIGSTTTKIGDPTGRDAARKMLTDNEIADNIVGIKKSLAKFITFGDNNSEAIMVDNGTWLEEKRYIAFLNDFGRLISVNRMLSMESVKQRLDRQQSLTFLEFNYAVLQAYDFYHLHKHYNCVVQIGGSDQWGNITMGSELCHKAAGGEVFGLTIPLLTTATGAKMGKSGDGAIWLNEEMLSPYNYYQYWRNCDDADVIRFAKLYAEFDSLSMQQFIQCTQEDINAAKKLLALRVTTLCHGIDVAESAHNAAAKLFERGEIDHQNLPSVYIEKIHFVSGITVIDLLIKAELTNSRSEGRQLIRGGGIKINNNKVTNEHMIINMDIFEQLQYVALSIGKKTCVLIKLI